MLMYLKTIDLLTMIEEKSDFGIDVGFILNGGLQMTHYRVIGHL